MATERNIPSKMVSCGDQLQYELDNANVPPEQRSDWPLPSFDARDWAKAWMHVFDGMTDEQVTEDWMVAWFANALMRGFDEARTRNGNSPSSDETEEIPARPYPGDEEAVRQAFGHPSRLPHCTCVARCDDDPHKKDCPFWTGVLIARNAWFDRNVAAWSCSQEAKGRPRCQQWCGHPQYCTATGTDRRRRKVQPPLKAEACQHDLLLPDPTVDVDSDGMGGSCRVCKQTWSFRRAKKASTDPNPLDPTNKHFRKCLKGHVSYSTLFPECPSCKVERERAENGEGKP